VELIPSFAVYYLLDQKPVGIKLIENLTESFSSLLIRPGSGRNPFYGRVAQRGIFGITSSLDPIEEMRRSRFRELARAAIKEVAQR
jgi:hypothetical protein